MIKLEMEFDSLKELQGFLTGLSGPVRGTAIIGADAARSSQEESVVKKDVTQGDHHADDRSTGAPDFAAVKSAILELSKSKGRDAALGVLAQFSDKNGVACQKVTAVREEDYPGLLEAARKAS